MERSVSDLTLDAHAGRRRFPATALAVLAIASLAGAPLAAQQSCTCPTTNPFGSCTIKTGNVPDQFPGAAAVVLRTPQPAFLYVADLYSGFTRRYLATNFAAPESTFPSPGGSRATTGIAVRVQDTTPLLYWAVGGTIIETDVDGDSARVKGEVDLAMLADLLGNLSDEALAEAGQTRESVRDLLPGTLGGITFHEGRNAFWGVDITNDVYFEFGEDGDLVLEAGMPVFFFNPKRNPLTGGAYGNSITYVRTPGGEFFDIPVGAIADRRPTEVHRVSAADTATSGIGDGAGVSYPLGAALGNPGFVTGIAYMADSCGAGQSSEFLLDIENEGQAKVIEVSADAPTAATIADFQCAPSGVAEVTLQWTKTLPYTSLKITRTRTSAQNPVDVDVVELTNFNADPSTHVDRGLLDGTYEYTAQVTATAPVPPVTCTVTLGLGSVAAHRRVFTGDADAAPFAVTLAKSDTVIVADLNTGKAESYTLDLEPKASFQGPFGSPLTTGVAYSPTDDALYWIQNDEGILVLQKTDLEGAPAGAPARVLTPAGLLQIPQLGEMSHDPVGNFLWTADMANSKLYGFKTDGTLQDAFKTAQVPSPQPSAVYGGGVGVADAQAATVLLDVVAGEQGSGTASDLLRLEINRASISAAPREVFRLDLARTAGTVQAGGIAHSASGDEKFGYVAGVDTRAIYKVRLTRTPGLFPFQRGDVNNDAVLNISDPSFLLARLFKGGAAPPCERAADVNDSNTVDITDAIDLFNYLFRGGPPPAPPAGTCGVDLDASPLSCAASLCNDA
jgi:hypothetical protein